MLNLFEIFRKITNIPPLRDIFILLAVCIGFIGLPSPGWAHPHCYILNSVHFLFDDQGASGVRLDWEFDQFFAAQILEDCDSGRDGILQDSDRICIRDNYFANLKDHDYFTFIKVNGNPLATGPARDYSVSLLDHRLVYQFTVPFRVPYSHRDTEVRVAVYDPTFYCAVTFPDALPILLENEGDLDYGAEVVENRQESYYYGQIHPWEAVLAFCQPPCEGTAPVDIPQAAPKGPSTRSVVVKEEPASTPAPSAATQMALKTNDQADHVSLGARTPQRMSFQQWLLRQQQSLYDRMATLVRAAKGPDRWRAILLLIGLAFVYGVIHAAGPGHGKAVASSFVLAQGPRLGKALLFANLIALFHGLSAVTLVLVLRLAVTAFTGATTGPVMGQADFYTRGVSYGLITAMGFGMTIKGIMDWKKKASEPQSAENARHFLVMAVLLGLVPCPGVVLVLLFCLSLGILPLGLVMALFQTLGMALTISVVTIVMTSGRHGMTALFSRYQHLARVLEHGLELTASLAVTALGLFFLTGLFSA